MVLAFLTIRATWVDEKFDPNNFLFPESEEVWLSAESEEGLRLFREGLTDTLGTLAWIA